MATKADVLRWIRALNRIYGIKVRFRTAPQWPGRQGPAAVVSTKTLLFPPGDIFYDLRVVAHEYAHLLREGTLTLGLSRERAHDATFENTYREVCLHLGAFATPTSALLEEFKRKLGIDPKAVQWT